MNQNGMPIKELAFTVNKDANTEEIKQSIPKLFKSFPKDKKMVKITNLYENGQYKSGRYFKYSDDDSIEIFDPSTYEIYDGEYDLESAKVKEVLIYVCDVPPSKGGKGELYDCFFLTLKKGVSRFPKIQLSSFKIILKFQEKISNW